MVVLTAPDPRSAASYWIEVLGYRCTSTRPERVVLERPGGGPNLELRRGPPGGYRLPPAREAAAIEVRVDLACMEAVWERDRARSPTASSPIAQPDGALVYLTCDPSGHALALVVKMAEPKERGEPVTRPLKPLGD